MAGMTTHVNLQADQQGTYRGISAQFSGDGFADMRFDVDAVSDIGFQAWLSGARTGSQVLDAATFARLAAPTRAQGTATYADVSSRLFEAIAAGRLPVAAAPVARE
jgi:cytochrome o ubiquinol oxidase subunit II